MSITILGSLAQGIFSEELIDKPRVVVIEQTSRFSEIRELAKSVGLVFPKEWMSNGFFVRRQSIAELLRQLHPGAEVCERELFRNVRTVCRVRDRRLSPPPCSGFFIGGDSFVTAGHCIKETIRNGIDESGVHSIRDIYVGVADLDNGSDLWFRSVYEVESVVDKCDERSLDFCLMKVSRIYGEEAPMGLDLRRTRDISGLFGSSVFAIGYPLGMGPALIEAEVVTSIAREGGTFRAPLDVVDGASGSPVFDGDYRVHGIVRGDAGGASTEVTRTKGCARIGRVFNRELGTYQSSMTNAWYVRNAHHLLETGRRPTGCLAFD